jgi:hypothetical protein
LKDRRTTMVKVTLLRVHFLPFPFLIKFCHSPRA